MNTPIPQTDPSPLPILEGIDLSGNNGEVDALKIVKEGRKSFVVLKCTEGVNWIDPSYAGNVLKFRDAQMPAITIYHYLRLRHERPQDADVQIQQSWEQYRKLQDLLKVELPRMWCDIELGENFGELLTPNNKSDVIAQARGEWRDCIMLALQTMHSLSARDGIKAPAIYTDNGEWTLLGGRNITEAATLPLVLASYTTDLNPSVPLPWSNMYVHQYAGDVGSFIGICSGVNGHCDLDRFRGTLAEFRSR